MADPFAIPTSDDPLGQGIAAAIAVRPNIGQHSDFGKYSNVFFGLRAQENLALQRLSDEVQSARLATATGKPLLELAASEFDVQLDNSPTFAVGSIAISRGGAGFSAGTIPTGTRIRRASNTTVQPPVVDATYVTTEAVFVPAHSGGVLLPIAATSTGSASNQIPNDGSSTQSQPATSATISFVDQIYDPTIGQSPDLVSFFASGGAEPYTDQEIRNAARQMVAGRFGPTLGAVLAGALLSQGVRRTLAFDDYISGITDLCVADGSFNGGSGGGNSIWTGKIKQYLIDNEFIGFGCRVNVVGATRAYITVSATIVLRDSKYQSYTTDINNNVRSVLNSYMLNRPDWYAIKASQFRAIISSADPRILTCTVATITNGVGVAVADTAALTIPVSSINYYTLTARGLQSSFVNPS